jgi:hypothetical protein
MTATASILETITQGNLNIEIGTSAGSFFYVVRNSAGNIVAMPDRSFFKQSEAVRYGKIAATKYSKTAVWAA